MGKIREAFFNSAKKEIYKEQQKKIDEYKKIHLGQEPSDERKKVLLKQSAESVREKSLRKLKISAGAVALAGLVGIGGFFALSENKTKELGEGQTKVEAVELDIDGDGEIDSSALPEQGNITWADSLKVDTEKIEKARILSEIKGLETQDDVLKYVKEIYAEVYNQENGTNITAENIRLDKNIDVLFFKYDTAENGDTIVRFCNSEENMAKQNQGLVAKIQVTIQDGDKTINESYLSNASGTIYNIYGKDEKVSENEQLSEQMTLAIQAVSEGISLAYEKSGTEKEKEYRNSLTNTVYELEEYIGTITTEDIEYTIGEENTKDKDENKVEDDLEL